MSQNTGSPLDPQQRPQMLQDQRQELGVGHFRQLGPPRPADEDPQQRLARRGAMRILLTAEAARQNRAVFNRRHHRPHAVQRMADVPQVVAQRDDRRARVFDLPQFRRQFRIDRGQAAGWQRCAGTATIRASNSMRRPRARLRPGIAARRCRCARSSRSGEFRRIDSGGNWAVIASTSVLSPADKRHEHAIASAALPTRCRLGRCFICCRMARIRLPCCFSISRKRESVALTLNFSMSAA